MPLKYLSAIVTLKPAKPTCYYDKKELAVPHCIIHKEKI